MVEANWSKREAVYNSTMSAVQSRKDLLSQKFKTKNNT